MPSRHRPFTSPRSPTYAAHREARLTAAVLAVAVASTPAQPQFSELGRGTFAVAARSNAVALGDVDGDGDLDLIVGNGWFMTFSSYPYARVGEQNRLYLNDGSGEYIDATAQHLPSDNDITDAVAFGDIDGDGDLDVVCGNTGYYSGGLNRIYVNDGSGHYLDATAAAIGTVYGKTNAVALGDVDGDSDLDLFFGDYGTPISLYLNDGRGVFTSASMSHLPVSVTNAMALGDVDGDGDLDIALANSGFYGGQNGLYLNDGTGTYSDATAARLPARTEATTAAVMADVDGDGDLDILFGNTRLVNAQNRLYLNDGTGTYADATVARMPPDSDRTLGMQVGDIDGDGDPDIVLGNGSYYSAAPQNRLYLNDGSGTYTDATAQRLAADRDLTFSVALGDADGDGDLDILTGNDGDNRLYRNLRRQVHTPRPTEIGQLYQLDAYARYGPSGTVDLAVPFVSTGRASIPVPLLGTLALDPAQMIRLPAFIIQQPDGMGSTSFVVPDLPGLVGASVHAQAVIVQYPVEQRLTNWTTDVMTQ